MWTNLKKSAKFLLKICSEISTNLISHTRFLVLFLEDDSVRVHERDVKCIRKTTLRVASVLLAVPKKLIIKDRLIVTPPLTVEWPY